MWGSGCSCHEAELKAGIKVECPHKGRRLREVPQFLQDLAADVERELGAGEFEESASELLLTASRCFSHVAGMANIKLSFANKLPYLLVHARSSDACRRILELYDAKAPGYDHP
eukprot:8171708-Alexandrium_andersonii.AAC.1